MLVVVVAAARADLTSNFCFSFVLFSNVSDVMMVFVVVVVLV